MSIITAIFQAILQAITYIIPVSQSAHSSIYHDFAGKADGSFASVTGAINIGIAIGIFLASFKLFARLATEFFSTGRDLVKKEFNFNVAKPTRKLMLMTLISFCPMLLWLIPIGKNGMLYKVLQSSAYNNTVFDDGLFLAILGALIFFSSRQLTDDSNTKFITVPMAAAVGVCSLVFIPVSGLALIGGVFSILVILGISQKLALRYSFVLSVPVLLVTGIVQLCTADIKSGIVPVIIGLVLSVPVAFFSVRLLTNIIKKDYLRYISYYDFSMAIIVVVIGIVQLIVRK